MTRLEKVKEAWFTNVLLLGFDAEEAEASYSTTFHPAMFDKSNVKGMEVVMHHLCTAIDPKESKEVFRGIWPIYDKAQARDFKRQCFSFLRDVEQRGGIGANVLRASHLTTASGTRVCAPKAPRGPPPPRSAAARLACTRHTDSYARFPFPVPGERFYYLLLHVSNEAIRASLRRAGAPVPRPAVVESGLEECLATAERAVKLRVRAQVERFLGFAANVETVHGEWVAFADRMRAAQTDVRKRRAAVDEELKTLVERVAAKGKDIYGEYAALERTPKLEEARKVWDMVEAAYDETSDSFQMMSDVVRNRYAQAEVTQEVARPLLDTAEGHLLAASVGQDAAHDEVDLTILLRQWTTHLTNLVKELRSVPAGEHGADARDKRPALAGPGAHGPEQHVDATMPVVATQVHQYHIHLENVRGLIKSVRATLPEIERSIYSLSAQVDKLTGDGAAVDAPLALVPPTPHAPFNLNAKTPAGVRFPRRAWADENSSPAMLQRLHNEVHQPFALDASPVRNSPSPGKRANARVSSRRRSSHRKRQRQLDEGIRAVERESEDDEAKRVLFPSGTPKTQAEADIEREAAYLERDLIDDGALSPDEAGSFNASASAALSPAVDEQELLAERLVRQLALGDAASPSTRQQTEAYLRNGAEDDEDDERIQRLSHSFGPRGDSSSSDDEDVRDGDRETPLFIPSHVGSPAVMMSKSPTARSAGSRTRSPFSASPARSSAAAASPARSPARSSAAAASPARSPARSPFVKTPASPLRTMPTDLSPGFDLLGLDDGEESFRFGDPSPARPAKGTPVRSPSTSLGNASSPYRSPAAAVDDVFLSGLDEDEEAQHAVETVADLRRVATPTYSPKSLAQAATPTYSPLHRSRDDGADEELVSSPGVGRPALDFFDDGPDLSHSPLL